MERAPAAFSDNHHVTVQPGLPDFQFWHALFVYRSGRRRMFAFGMYASERVDPGMEIFAHRIANLVGMPYEGYRESKGCWLSG